MPRLLFDGLILHDGILQHVDAVPSDEDANLWDVVSFSTEKIVLKTFNTKEDAKVFINAMSDKMVESEAFIDVIDLREREPVENG